MLQNINELADELVSQLEHHDVNVIKTYDDEINAYMLNLGKHGTIRITAYSVKKKWSKYRFELSNSYNNGVKLKIEKGSIYYQVPLDSYEWIVNFIINENNKNYLLYNSSVHDMAMYMKDELDKENMLVSVYNKRDGIYLKSIYETVRISDTPPKKTIGFQYDLRKDKLKKSIIKNKSKKFTVSFNHYKWVIKNMKETYATKEKLSVHQVAKDLKTLLLQEDIKVIERESSTTNSIYLNLDYDMLGTIRISDHKTHKKNNKYDICSMYHFLGKGKRTDDFSFVYCIPIEKWKNVIHFIKKDRNHKLKKLGKNAYNFKVETNKI